MRFVHPEMEGRIPSEGNCWWCGRKLREFTVTPDWPSRTYHKVCYGRMLEWAVRDCDGCGETNQYCECVKEWRT